MTQIVNIPNDSASPYRAKDIVMSATVDIASRTVFLTGAIDSPDHDILVRVDLPDPGRWTVIKSETNLTNESWGCWQITFGEGTKVVKQPVAPNMSQQFKQVFVSEDASRICFFDGEVRPGEPVLKQFTLETLVPRIVMSHNRQGIALFPAEHRDHRPDVPETIRNGFAPRPVIESWIQAFIRN